MCIVYINAYTLHGLRSKLFLFHRHFIKRFVSLYHRCIFTYLFILLHSNTFLDIYERSVLPTSEFLSSNLYIHTKLPLIHKNSTSFLSVLALWMCVCPLKWAYLFVGNYIIVGCFKEITQPKLLKHGTCIIIDCEGITLWRIIILAYTCSMHTSLIAETWTKGAMWCERDRGLRYGSTLLFCSHRCVHQYSWLLRWYCTWTLPSPPDYSIPST
jgi:hypothetical protein